MSSMRFNSFSELLSSSSSSSRFRFNSTPCFPFRWCMRSFTSKTNEMLKLQMFMRQRERKRNTSQQHHIEQIHETWNIFGTKESMNKCICMCSACVSPFSILHHSYDKIHKINTVTTPTTISNKCHHHENEKSHKESEINEERFHIICTHHILMILLSTMYVICSAAVGILPESQTHFNQCIPSRSHFHANS